MKRYIDARKRSYAAYVDAMLELGLTPVTEQAFREQRRGRATEDLIEDVRGPDRVRSTKQHRERAGASSVARLDALIPGARATLAALRKSYELGLVTPPEDRETLPGQIDDLDSEPT